MRLLFAVLAIAGALSAAQAGALRTKQHWGGPDLRFSCETVRGYRAEIARMDPDMRSALIRQFNVTRKMQRQARACLRR